MHHHLSNKNREPTNCVSIQIHTYNKASYKAINNLQQTPLNKQPRNSPNQGNPISQNKHVLFSNPNIQARTTHYTPAQNAQARLKEEVLTHTQYIKSSLVWRAIDKYKIVMLVSHYPVSSHVRKTETKLSQPTWKGPISPERREEANSSATVKHELIHPLRAIQVIFAIQSAASSAIAMRCVVSRKRMKW